MLIQYNCHTELTGLKKKAEWGKGTRSVRKLYLKVSHKEMLVCVHVYIYSDTHGCTYKHIYTHTNTHTWQEYKNLN